MALSLQAQGFALVHHVEIRIESREDGVLLQQPGAESVDRGDVGAFQLAANFGVLRKSANQPFVHVAGGLVGEGNGENAQRIDAAFDQQSEILNQDRGFAGARAGDDAGVARRLLHGNGGN